jgi:hypothetical protein
LNPAHNGAEILFLQKFFAKLTVIAARVRTKFFLQEYREEDSDIKKWCWGFCPTEADSLHVFVRLAHILRMFLFD